MTARRPNLIFTRGGNDSLHPLWLAQKNVERTWDLHVSYFGDKGAPTGADQDGVSFTQDEARYKWGGMNVCLQKKPFNLDDYEYIAFPDDDLVVTTEGWNRAFAMMKQYDLHAAQLALHQNSFYTINMTLQRPGTRLRYTSYVECMVPVARVEVFKKISEHFHDPQSSWGIDHVISDMLKDKPNSMAMLDAVPALHTRAHGVSHMYKDMTSGGVDYYQAEAAFLGRLGLKRTDRRTLGALDWNGNPVTDLTWLKKPIFSSRIRRIIRHYRKITRIVSINDDPAKIERALAMVAPR